MVGTKSSLAFSCSLAKNRLKALEFYRREMKACYFTKLCTVYAKLSQQPFRHRLSCTLAKILQIKFIVC